MRDIEQLITTTGMYGKECVSHPKAAHATEKIRKLAAKGRESMRKRTNGYKHCLITKPSRSENLALMVAALGWENARSYIATVYHRIGSAQPAAATLHVPEAVIWAVLLGTFPGEIAEV
jgi:hypothetical protein